MTDTVVERAWVRDFDREKNEELNEFKRYYVEKEYNLTDNDNNKYKIVMHVDDFDRYNIGHKAWVGSLGTASKEVLASALESLSVDLNDCVFRDDYGKNFKSSSRKADTSTSCFSLQTKTGSSTIGISV